MHLIDLIVNLSMHMFDFFLKLFFFVIMLNQSDWTSDENNRSSGDVCRTFTIIFGHQFALQWHLGKTQTFDGIKSVCVFENNTVIDKLTSLYKVTSPTTGLAP